MTSKKDHITVDGIQKIQELEVEDKYKVLEFLVKEMMQIKDQIPPPQERYYHRYYDSREDSYREGGRRDTRDVGDFRKQNNTQQ